MGTRHDYTGTHKVVLPSDYLNSIEAAVDLHGDQIAAVAANLECPHLQPGRARRVLRSAAMSVMVWAAPVSWMTCL